MEGKRRFSFMTPVFDLLPLAPAPGGMAFFAAWQACRLVDTHRKPMGASGLGQAAFVWRKWLDFCACRGLAWEAAGPFDVQAFAGAVSPRKLTAAAGVSPVTLKRYWRILHDVYAHAVLSHTLADNPCSDVRPALSEKTSSLALPAHLWALLQEGLPGGPSFKAKRNRLVLHLLMRCALTVTEILGLTLGCVQAHAGTPGQVAGQDDGRPAGPTYTLALSGSRPVQARCLVLDTRTSAALHDWLELRSIGNATVGDRLLVGAPNSAALSAKGLYKICRAHMARRLPDIEIAQMGPNTLRNTCIAMWLNAGVPLLEIQQRCGLKDASVLIRLQPHVNPMAVL